MGEPVRLHLGCGGKIWPGYINVDFPGNWSGKKPDVECDIRKLPYPDEYADNITAIHVIEHFHRLEVEEVLAEWRRVLKPGGVLVLEMPCIDKIARHVIERNWHDGPSYAKWMQLTLIGIFGDINKTRRHPEMAHQWCYCIDEIGILLREFSSVTLLEPQWHYKQRDIRVEAVK